MIRFWCLPVDGTKVLKRIECSGFFPLAYELKVLHGCHESKQLDSFQIILLSRIKPPRFNAHSF